MVLGTWLVLTLSKKGSEWLLGKLVSELVQLLLHCCSVFRATLTFPLTQNNLYHKKIKKKCRTNKFFGEEGEFHRAPLPYKIICNQISIKETLLGDKRWSVEILSPIKWCFTSFRSRSPPYMSKFQEESTVFDLRTTSYRTLTFFSVYHTETSLIMM